MYISIQKLNSNSTLNTAAQFIFTDGMDGEKIMEAMAGGSASDSILQRVGGLSNAYELLRKGISAEIK